MAGGKRRTLAWENEYPNNTFTDRETFRADLRNAVVAPQAIDEDRIIMVYGAGGMGKSALKDYFIRHILAKEDLADVVYASIDFEYEERTRNVEEATVRIARDLIEKGGIPLPAFSLGFIRYMMKTSPENNLQSSYAYLFKFRSVEGDLAGYAFEKLIEYGVDELRAGASLIPGVGYLIKKASEKGHGKLLEWLQKTSAGKVLQGIDEMLPGELRQKLPIWLAYDIYTYLQAQTDKANPYPSKRIVIVMDGFEWLWAKEQHKAEKTKELDEWLRQFMENCPGVLYLMFGREKLHWGQFHNMFAEDGGFTQLALSGLGKEDAVEYLRKCKVEDPAIQEVMVTNSIDHESAEGGCLPFYLDIMARTHWAIVQGDEKPVPADFERLGNEVVRHFFQHLNEDITTAIKVLSCAPYIDEEVFRTMVTHAFISPSVSLKTLYSFSFVRQDGNKAGLHGLIRNLASEMYAEEFPHLFHDVHRVLFDLFEAKLPKEQREMTGQMEFDLLNAGNSIALLSTVEFRSWIIQKAMLYYGHNSQATMPGLLHRALDNSYLHIRAEVGDGSIIVGQRPVEETMDIAFLNYHLGSYYHDWDDQHLAAVRYVDQVKLICEFYLGEAVAWTFKSYGKSIPELALDAYMLDADILTQLNKFIKAGKAYAKARSHAARYHLYFDTSVYANYLTKAGRLAEAEPLLFSQLNYAENMIKNPEVRHLWFEHTGYLAHDIAKLMREDGRFAEALQYHERAIAVYSQTRTAEHPYVAVVKAELAKTLIQSRSELDKAENILAEVYPVLTKSYEEDHLHMASYHLHVFELMLLKGDYERSDMHYNLARKILNAKIGLESRAAFAGMLRMFLSLNEQWKASEITDEEYLESGDILAAAVLPNMEILKRLFSVYNPFLIRMLGYCEEVLLLRGRHAEAERLRKTIAECERISRERVAIRLAGLDILQVQEEKAETLALIAAMISVPDFGEVNLLRVELPFYAGLRLYKIIYTKATGEPRRYVLSDGVNVIPVDYDPGTLNRLGHYLELDIDNALLYLRFYFDASCDDAGCIYIIASAGEIPWRLDVNVTNEQKQKLSAHIRSSRIVSEDEAGIQAEAFYISGDALLRGRFDISRTGAVKIILSERCYFRESGEIIFLDQVFDEISGERTGSSFYDLEHNTIEVPQDELISNVIPAGVDPIYAEEVDFNSLSKTNQLRQGLSGCMQVLQIIQAFNLAPASEGQQIVDDINWLKNVDLPDQDHWLEKYIRMIQNLIQMMETHKEGLATKFSDDDEGRKTVDNQIAGLKNLMQIASSLLDGDITFR